ncbi:unnamed protein product [Porites evermanni]|uniref:CHAT domain-containing protein n=1 Tax=Porites evermanni TaxID=104178 RepID=A0ABN8RFI9_9CNID|nr:unnamed protein product [Porites evermanni]
MISFAEFPITYCCTLQLKASRGEPLKPFWLRKLHFLFRSLSLNKQKISTAMNNLEQLVDALCIGVGVAALLLNTNRVEKAIQVYKECVLLLNNKALEKEKEFVELTTYVIYFPMIIAYRLMNNPASAIECGRELMAIQRRTGKRDLEGKVMFELAMVYEQQLKYEEAKEYYPKALPSYMATGQKREEAFCYGKLGSCLMSLGEYGKAKECLEKGIVLSNRIGVQDVGCICYSKLGTLFYSFGEYGKAKENLEKALAISKETGDKRGEATSYGNLGNVFKSTGEYLKAKKYFKTALSILGEIGDKKERGSCYSSLATIFLHLGEGAKAKEYLEKALVMAKEVGARRVVASCYCNLATVAHLHGENAKAKEYLEKALVIVKKVGDKRDEATCYGNLGEVLQSIGSYAEAKEHFEKSLTLAKNTGYRELEAVQRRNLGTLSQALGEYSKAKEYLEEALLIAKEIGNQQREALFLGDLGTVFQDLEKYVKARECHEKALTIHKKIGNRAGEAATLGNLGRVYKYFGEYDMAVKFLYEALDLAKEIDSREYEAKSYQHLGTVFLSLNENAKANEYLEKALVMHKEEGSKSSELTTHFCLSLLMLNENHMHEAKAHLFESTSKAEDMRSLLGEDDNLKVSLFDEHVHCYKCLSYLFCANKDPSNALYAAELGRARALADLMLSKYSMEKGKPVNPQSWVGIEGIVKNESRCVCLYVSYYEQFIFLWLLKDGEPMLYRSVMLDNCKALKLVEYLGSGTRGNQVKCEDRSWCPSNVSEPKRESASNGDIANVFQISTEETQEILAFYYQMIINPVADVLEEPEIVFVPDRVFYKLPFAALKDQSGKYLSEAFRIRVVPSLTTLRLIQDSPADYHSQTGALIVGDPDVGQVRYEGEICHPPRLPFALREAEVISQLLGTKPLVGKHATKQVILQSINSVSLIHFAAHGNAERGEIVLTPSLSTNAIPQEEDYLLTMADIAHVRLRSKLVVLSCCHSAEGQIRAEGVVGIARAFLGAGARSVLVALWAIDDIATEQFMSRFYEHLVRGESASESLYQAS